MKIPDALETLDEQLVWAAQKLTRARQLDHLSDVAKYENIIDQLLDAHNRLQQEASHA